MKSVCLHGLFRSRSTSPTSVLRLLRICLSLQFVQAFINVTVNSDSTLITYHPATSWTRIADDDNLDAGGSHMVTEDPTAYATLSMSFVSFFYLSPLWPYAVTAQLTVDETTHIIDLQDHSFGDAGISSGAKPTTQSHPVAFIENPNGDVRVHTIRISMPSVGHITALDSFIFQQLSGPSIPYGAAQGTSSPSMSSTASITSTSVSLSSVSSAVLSPIASSAISNADVNTRSSFNHTVIALATTIPLILLFSVCTFWKYYASRKRRTRSKHISNIDPDFEVPVESIIQITPSVHSVGGDDTIPQATSGRNSLASSHKVNPFRYVPTEDRTTQSPYPYQSHYPHHSPTPSLAGPATLLDSPKLSKSSQTYNLNVRPTSIDQCHTSLSHTSSSRSNTTSVRAPSNEATNLGNPEDTSRMHITNDPPRFTMLSQFTAGGSPPSYLSVVNLGDSRPSALNSSSSSEKNVF